MTASTARQSAVRVAIVLVICILISRLEPPQQKNVVPKIAFKDTVVLLDPSGSANSSLIDQWCDDNSFELRRYSSDVDTSRVESEIENLITEGKDSAPCIVVLRSGKVTSAPMPSNVLAYLKELK
tara:strand:- start:627 stop:1001 length:375 start_codon:yes stop_codon:yes gene_type:complete